MLSERMNQGYAIIDSVCVGKTEFVLGENPNAPSRYVTWQCKDGDNYYWGNYMDDFYTAKLDLYKRVSDEISYLRSIGALPPAQMQNDIREAKDMGKHMNLNPYKSKSKHRHEPER